MSREIVRLSVMILLLGIARPQLSAQERPMTSGAIEAFKKNVREAARTTSTITCDFTQEKVMSMIAERITSSGKFYLKKEKMLRWEYIKPYSYLIVIRNDQFYIKDENKVNQFNVQSNKVFSEINRIILGSLQGTLLQDDKNFRAAYSETSTDLVVRLTTLTPRLKEALNGIVIWFDRRDFTVNRLEMIESGGDRTVILFSGKKINQPIADEMFVVH